MNMAAADNPMRMQVSEELRKREAIAAEIRKRVETVSQAMSTRKPMDAIRLGDIRRAQELLELQRNLKKELQGLSRSLEEAEKSVHMAKERLPLYQDDEDLP